MDRGLQPSFAGGELAPSMYGRVDLSKYQTGLKTCKNFFVRPQGGVENRPGTHYVATALGQTRLIPFSYSVEQSYFLEFTNNMMRVIKDGGLVLRPLSTSIWSWTKNGATDEYYLRTAAGSDPNILQPATDEVYINSAVATKGTPGSLAAGTWGWGDVNTLGYNTIYVRLSDASDPDGKSDYYVSCVSRTTSPYAYSDLAELRFTPAADTMFFAHKDYPAYKLTRADHFDWTFTAIQFQATASAPTGLTATRSSNLTGTARTYYYKVSAIVNGEESLPSDAASVQIISPWTAGGTIALAWNPVMGAEAYNVYKSSRGYYGWIGQVDAGTLAYTDDNIDPDVSDGPKESYNPFDDRTLLCTSDWKWTQNGIKPEYYLQTAAGGNPNIVEPVAGEVYLNGVAASIDNAGDLSASTWVWGDKNTLGYNTLYVRLSDDADPDTKVDDYVYIRYTSDIGTKWPGAVGIYEQRMVYAATQELPQTVFCSQTGNLANFTTSRPLKDSDSIEFTIASRQVNEVRHIVPLDKLILLTSGAEWVMSAGSNADAISPTSISVRVQSYRGCSDIPPLVIGSTVLFVQRDGSTVQDLGYSFAADKYEATNLSIVAAHLFDGRTIKEWAYQQRPNSTIFCVMSDGTLMCLTYLKEHEVWGWSQHTTDGLFQSVAAIPGLGEIDEVCFVVKRTIGGAPVYYIETLTERLPDGTAEAGVFLDSSISYDVTGAATATFTGLSHLNGETVNALADGSPVKGLTVTAGSVTLPQAAEVVHIGLEIPTPTLEMLPLDLQGTQGRKRRINRVTLRLDKSRGFWAGPDTTRMVEAKWRSTEDYNEPISLFTGDKEVLLSGTWGIESTLVIQQRDPLPLAVNAVMPEFDFGG